MTAILGIQEKINPCEKRKSRDMETITELEFLGPNSPIHLARKLTDSDGQSTPDSSTESPCHCPYQTAEVTTSAVDTNEGLAIEIVTNGNDPFLGLTKGSIPIGQRRIKSQIYENVIIGKQKRISVPGIHLTFDPVEEGEEREDFVPNSPSRVAALKKMLATDIQAGVAGSTSGQKATESTKDISRTSNGVAEASKKYPGVKMRKPDRKRETLADGATGSPLDENEEWAKIADILSSCGGRMSTYELSSLDYFEKRMQQIFAEGGKKMQSVGDWLESLELAQYENLLIANGFDDMDFVGPNVLEADDLAEIGVTNSDHKKTILESVATLPPLQPIAESGMPRSVEEWLESLHLSAYLDAFNRNQFTSMDRVKQIWDLELTTVLDVSLLGHRKRILGSLKFAPDEDKWSNVDNADEVIDIISAINWTDDSIKDLPLESGGADEYSVFKDYTQIKPKAAKPNDLLLQQPSANGQTVENKSGKEIKIRPLSSANQESPVRQWKHPPEMLIKGCCNYTTQYLGSTLVKELQGADSTKESINKMKKSSDNILKVPQVILSISYTGVKFIDANSKRVICEHEIGNIFCACQDGDDLNYFAYITKDLDTDRHYCHVFMVKSTEQATEVILTLGEAFEVAYQMALKGRAEMTQTEVEMALPRSATDDDQCSCSSTADVSSPGASSVDTLT